MECGEEKEKIKNKKRMWKVGDRKVVAGAKCALMEGCRERKTETCSVRKDVTDGSLLAG